MRAVRVLRPFRGVSQGYNDHGSCTTRTSSEAQPAASEEVCLKQTMCPVFVPKIPFDALLKGLFSCGSHVLYMYPLFRESLEERLLDQAQASALFTPPFLGSFA